MKKIYLIISLSIFYAYFLKAQNSINASIIRTTKWETTDIGNGITYQHFHFNEKQLFNANENINILRIKNKSRKAQFAFASGGDSLILTSTMAQNAQALAAVNGTFFDTKKGGSVDFIKIDDKILDSTRQNGKKLAEHQQAAIAIKRNKVVILNARDSLDFGWEKKLKFPNVMVTGPLLIKNSQAIPLSKTAFVDNRHPRTCACITTKNDVLMVTIDGRTAESYGVSLPELTQILLQLDCKNAINFDGGGSSTLWINSKTAQNVPNTEGSSIMNMPCDNKKFDHEGERKVSNIFMVKKR